MFYLLSFFIMVATLGLMVLVYYYNQESPKRLLQQYNIDTLINKAPTIEKDNQELISYFLEQFKMYLFDLYESGKINNSTYSNVVSAFYGANNIFKFLINEGVVDWEYFLENYFYPLPPSTIE